MNVKNEIRKLYEQLGIDYLEIIPKRNKYKVLKKSLEKEHDKKLHDELDDLIFELLLTSINYQDEMYRLLYAYPLLPAVFYELYSLAHPKDKIEILEAVIESYEILYQGVINLEMAGEHKIYVLALDELARNAKRNNQTELSLELYQKAILNDPSNKFGYIEQNLLNYVILDKYDDMKYALEKLDNDNTYKIFVQLLNKLISSNNIDREYIKALHKNERLINAICKHNFNLIDQYDLMAQEFYNDFIEFFHMDKKVVNKLKYIHYEKA